MLTIKKPFIQLCYIKQKWLKYQMNICIAFCITADIFFILFFLINDPAKAMKNLINDWKVTMGNTVTKVTYYKDVEGALLQGTVSLLVCTSQWKSSESLAVVYKRSGSLNKYWARDHIATCDKVIIYIRWVIREIGWNIE